MSIIKSLAYEWPYDDTIIHLATFNKQQQQQKLNAETCFVQIRSSFIDYIYCMTDSVEDLI